MDKQTDQIKLAKFQREAINACRSTNNELCIALVQRYGFFHGHGDLNYNSILKCVAKSVKIKVLFGISLDDDDWINREELIALGQIENELNKLHENIEFRYTWEWTGPHLLITDTSKVLATRMSLRYGQTILPTLFNYSSQEDIEQHVELFNRMWIDACKEENNYHIKYTQSPEDIFTLSLLKKDWQKIIEKLNENPNYIRTLNAREFEELVVSIISPFMTTIVLTQEKRDGGRDIIATKETPVGQQLFLIECKHNSPDNPVGVEIIRALYGVLEIEKATSGIVITSASFTSGAKEIQKTVQYRLSLKDYNDILSIIRQQRTNR